MASATGDTPPTAADASSPAATASDGPDTHLEELRVAVAKVRTETTTAVSQVGKKNRKKRRLLQLEGKEKETRLANKCIDVLMDLGAEDAEKLVADLLANLQISTTGPGGAAAAPPPAPASSKSRAQKKREKRERQEKKRAAEKKALEAEIAAAGPSPKQIETGKLEAKLRAEELRIRTIASDGHCMYRSLAAQLQLAKETATAAAAAAGAATMSSIAARIAELPGAKAYQALRDLAASHMLAHSADFSPFFVPQEGAPDTSFAAHCEAVRTTSMWGGQMELRALAEALQHPVLVYRADSDLLTMEAGRSASGLRRAPLRVSYHLKYYALGEHYNSVEPLKR